MTKISEEMPITIDIEKDGLYKLGYKKAAKEAKVQAKQLAKTKAEKKLSIQKMKATNRFSDKEIMDFLNLDKETFKQYIQEIAEGK